MSSEGSGRHEEFRVAGDRVVETIKRLVREGNARRIIIRRPSGEIIREISLTRGLAAGGLLALIAPVLAAIGAVVALLSEVRIEVVRDEPSKHDDERTNPTGNTPTGPGTTEQP